MGENSIPVSRRKLKILHRSLLTSHSKYRFVLYRLYWVSAMTIYRILHKNDRCISTSEMPKLMMMSDDVWGLRSEI